MKFKMTATTGLSLTLDPMGKMFQNASSLKPLLKPNCPWIIIWKSSKKFGFFMPIRNPRWLPPQVIVLTQDHMGKYRNNFFSEAIALIEPKLFINHWKVLYKLRVFYVYRNSKMTTTAGHSFYIGPIGFFLTRWTIQALESLWFILELPPFFILELPPFFILELSPFFILELSPFLYWSYLPFLY